MNAMVNLSLKSNLVNFVFIYWSVEITFRASKGTQLRKLAYGNRVCEAIEALQRVSSLARNTEPGVPRRQPHA
jgi:hypothetical protein